MIQGFMTQGLMIQGFMIQGLMIQGLMIQGLMIQGLMIQGRVIQGLMMLPRCRARSGRPTGRRARSTICGRCATARSLPSTSRTARTSASRTTCAPCRTHLLWSSASACCTPRCARHAVQTLRSNPLVDPPHHPSPPTVSACSLPDPPSACVI
eukprot:5329328-Pyramimonas_sp.AAC.1